MRRLLRLVPAVLLMGCSLLGGGVPNVAPSTVSCQPWGFTPAPIPFSLQAGPVTSDAAEQSAVAMYRACHAGAGTITELTSDTTAGTGNPHGPNAGQAVWVVKVDAVVTPPNLSEGYGSHFWIEVNQATGVPVLIAYG